MVSNALLHFKQTHLLLLSSYQDTLFPIQSATDVYSRLAFYVVDDLLLTLSRVLQRFHLTLNSQMLQKRGNTILLVAPAGSGVPGVYTVVEAATKSSSEADPGWSNSKHDCVCLSLQLLTNVSDSRLSCTGDSWCD